MAIWWETRERSDATCLYGEITVLATHPGIYYAGANWHPGEPAGGYCGIQHNGPTEKRTIFSVWDTSPTLHPKVANADPETVVERFTNEGKGAHTHMLWDWMPGHAFQYFLQKRPAPNAQNTEVRYFVFDDRLQQWRHSATIVSPNGDAKSVQTIAGGSLASFLENFSQKDHAIPKLALYRLWLGTAVNDLKCLTEVVGDGNWGVLNDSYFLAEGNPTSLWELFNRLEEKYGPKVDGLQAERVNAISDRPLSDELRRRLNAVAS